MAKLNQHITSICIRFVGYLLHDHLDIRWFHEDSCLWVVVWWEVISLAMGYNLASHCKSLIYHRTPKTRFLTYLSMYEPQEIRVSACLPICVSFSSVWTLKNKGIMFAHLCAHCLMCGFSFSSSTCFFYHFDVLFLLRILYVVTIFFFFFEVCIFIYRKSLD
jgi:hypothetical protein